jgi:hypothetical protein
MPPLGANIQVISCNDVASKKLDPMRAPPNVWFAGIIASSIVFGLTVSGQSDTKLIEWSKDRKLRRADFKGPVVVAQAGVVARSFVSVQASWTCEGDRLDVKIRAVFDPSQSTWVPQVSGGFEPLSRRPASMNDMQLLEHEQTHFDIAEIIARKIRTHFAELTDVCTRRGGTVPLAAIVEDYQRELEDEQARYDRQTRFGTDARTQWTWTSQVQKALASR